jgi:SAM-dependent methyltransferase
MMKDKVMQLLINHYVTNGEVPWSPGYFPYRQRFILDVLSDNSTMEKFRSNESLPGGYGVGLDERCIEYPWLLSRLRDESGRVLDAGAALNHEFLLDQPIWSNKRLHIVTLNPEQSCFWERGISYLFEDLRDLPAREHCYDDVICISTIEHVGCDNRMFTGNTKDGEDSPNDFIVAMGELRRVLKPGGRLLLTVPFGRYRHLGTQQIFNIDLINKTKSAFDPSEVKSTFFKYDAEGWQLTNIMSCSECEYVDWVMMPKEIRPKKFPIQADRAVAARAVACLELTKRLH